MLYACINNMINHLTTRPPWLLLVSFLGVLPLLKSSLFLLKWVYKSCLRPPKNLIKQYGSWALITGATDGIGKAFAFQLAQKGLNLILISRDQIKLQKVASEIHAKYPNIETKIVELDFTTRLLGSNQDTHLLLEAIEGVDVGVLVNNVGTTYPSAMYFHEVEEKVWLDVVRVNLEATTWITKAVLKGMVFRRRGAIVNVGSGASVVVPSHPLYSIYAATKAYVDQLSRCLYVEYKRYGIDVQCQVPLYVATKMASKVASKEGASIFVPSPGDYVKWAINRIGYEPRCTPYWSHSLQWFLANLVPESRLDMWRLSIGLSRKAKV